MKAIEKFRAARAGVAEAMTSAQGAVADVRAQIATVEDRIREVEKRPFSKADVLAKAAMDVARHADAGHTLLKRAAQQAAFGEDGDLFRFVAEPQDLRAVLSAVAGDALLSAYTAQVEARWADDAGLTDEERSAELVRLHGDLFDLELMEERVIREAEAAGIAIDRRKDQHPASILARDEDLPG